jgi:competence protein ComEC
MMSRPAFRLIVLLLPGILAADRTEVPPALAVGGAGLVLVSLLAAWRGGRPLAARAALCLLPSFLYLAWNAPRTAPLAAEIGPPVRLRGRVATWGTGSRTVRFVPEEGPLRGRALTLRVPRGEETPRPGLRLACEGKLRPHPAPRNPGEWDAHACDRRRGDAALLDASTIKILGSSSPLDPVRGAIAEHGRRLGGEEGALFVAFFLADRSRLDADLTAAFRATGLTHLIALSGLNLAILYLVVSAPLSSFVPKKRVPAAALAVLWIFGAVASYPVSLLRALVMASVLAAARWAERPLDAWNALAVAALSAIVTDPAAPWDASFRLSFAATAGILAVVPLAARFGSSWWGRIVVAPLLVGLAAQTATLPIVLHQFGTFAPFGAVATLLASPFTTFGLAAGSAWLILGRAHPALDSALLNATWGTLAPLRVVTAWLARIGPPMPTFSSDVSSRAALFMVLLLLPVWARKRPRLRLAALFPLLIPLVPLRDPYPLRVTILDVGQGSAAVAELPGGETLVFDTGPCLAGRDAGKLVVLPFLQRRGAIPVDLLTLSHPDGDHTGGTNALIHGARPRLLLDCGLVPAESLEISYSGAAVHSRVPWTSARSGARYAFRDGTTLDVLFAAEGRLPPEKPNASSLVLLLRYKRFSILLPGDTTPEVEEYLARTRRLGAATVLVAAHHGARIGCTMDMLRATRPAVAVISVSARNRYGHPARHALERLEAAGCSVFRTDRHGAVTIRTDGRRVAVSGNLPGSPSETIDLGFRPGDRGSGAAP